MSSNLSRRSFLKGAAALAVVSAASGVLAGCSIGVNGGAVSGTGAVRTFTDGENVITITSTDFDLYSIPGDPVAPGFSNVIVMPSFKVKNDSKSTITFVGSTDDVVSGGYTIVATACFDGKRPESEPLENTSGSGSGSGSSSVPTTSVTNFADDGVGANSTTSGILAYVAPFKNWSNMVVTMTLCKKDKNGQTVEVGTATYTFRQ